MAYPKEVIDPHHHFLDTANNSFQSFLHSLVTSGGVNTDGITYLPEHYTSHVIQPLAKIGVTMSGTVHVEAMPDSGHEEAAWVEQLCRKAQCSYVKGIVASCDLTQDMVELETNLEQIMQASPKKLKGIRWILDCVGPYQKGGTTATHVATLRHDGVDYLQSPKFERGLALLDKYNLSFDLQCAPIQLVDSAAALFGKYPNLRVCIDHLGKPRKLLGDDYICNINNSDDDGSNEEIDRNSNSHGHTNSNKIINPNIHPDQKELQTWRNGMKAMSSLPNVYVKLSMMGYAVPGWIRTPQRQSLLKSLVRETIDMFGPHRCMVAWNWHVNGAVSDADGLSDVGPGAVELLDNFMWFFDGYGEDEREKLFAGTAREFYRLEE